MNLRENFSNLFQLLVRFTIDIRGSARLVCAQTLLAARELDGFGPVRDVITTARLGDDVDELCSATTTPTANLIITSMTSRCDEGMYYKAGACALLNRNGRSSCSSLIYNLYSKQRTLCNEYFRKNAFSKIFTFYKTRRYFS